MCFCKILKKIRVWKNICWTGWWWQETGESGHCESEGEGQRGIGERGDMGGWGDAARSELKGGMGTVGWGVQGGTLNFNNLKLGATPQLRAAFSVQ